MELITQYLHILIMCEKIIQTVRQNTKQQDALMRSVLNLSKYRNKIKHKFNAKAVTTDNGKKFQSQLEHAYYQHLNIIKRTGEVLFFHRQVPIELDMKNTMVTKYYADFQVFYADGTVKYIDVKGVETQMFKVKKKMVEALYPFEIQIIKRGDF